MVKVSDLKIGDRVKVVDRWGPGCIQEPNGKMDMYLGQIMTVLQITTVYERVKFEECPTWVWSEQMLDEIIEDNYDCEIDEVGDINALFDFE